MASEFEPDFSLVQPLIPKLNPEVASTRATDSSELRAYIHQERRQEAAVKRSPVSMDYYFAHGLPSSPIRLFGQHADTHTIVDNDMLKECGYPQQLPEVNLYVRENILTLTRGISYAHNKPISLDAFVYDTANPSSTPLPAAGKIRVENVLVVNLLKDTANSSQVLVLCVDRVPIASIGYHDTKPDANPLPIPTLTVTFSPDLFFNNQPQTTAA